MNIHSIPSEFFSFFFFDFLVGDINGVRSSHIVDLVRFIGSNDLTRNLSFRRSPASLSLQIARGWAKCCHLRRRCRRRWSMKDGWWGMGGGRSDGRSFTCATSCSRLGCWLTTSVNLRIIRCWIFVDYWSWRCIFARFLEFELIWALLLVLCGYQVPIKTMLIDGNCRVEDRGLKTHHGHVSSFFHSIFPSELGYWDCMWHSRELSLWCIISRVRDY